MKKEFWFVTVHSSDQCIFMIFFCISCHVYVQDETVREKGNPAEVINTWENVVVSPFKIYIHVQLGC